MSMESEKYLEFWRTHFPEQQTLDREQALHITGRMQQYRTIDELRTYQDTVASVYGSYERTEFQVATFEKLLLQLQRIPVGGRTLLSLGSGPASYELWLLAQNRVQKCILVDISMSMLERAGKIAEQLHITDRVEMICSDISSVTLPDESADLCFSINSLHWDREWRTWVKKAIKCTKPGGCIFLTASMLFPQSEITPDQFVGVTERGVTLREKGYLVPGSIVGRKVAQTTRFFVTGTKKTAKELRTKK